MKKHLLIVGILALLISSTLVPISLGIKSDNSKEQLTFEDYIFDSYRISEITSHAPYSSLVDNSKVLSIRGKIVYAFVVYGGSSGHALGPCYFDLYDPSDIIRSYSYMGTGFASGGTWTNDGRWLACEFLSGCLWEITPEGEIMWIGGGGTGLNGLAYNPITKKLYGASSYALYEIDIQTGEQYYIGPFNTQTIIGIAFDANGILYAWDVKFDGDSYLYTIDVTTGQAKQVGSMGMTLCYAQDGAFDYETDTLYLSAYIIEPYYGSYLIECDADTGNCNIIGPFEGYAEIAALAIPYNWTGLTTDFTWKPKHPNPDETILFNASKSFSPNADITLYEWDWNNDGVFDENHTFPTVTHTWSSIGYFKVTLRVTDNSNLTGIQRKTIRVGNHPPDTPSIIGPNIGKPGEEYFYKFMVNDPDEDNIYLRISWGDNNNTGWIGPYNSGEEEILTHTWNESGIYTLRAKVKDIYDAESEWTEFTVTMPRDKSTNNMLFWRLLERFPMLERFLNSIEGW